MTMDQTVVAADLFKAAMGSVCTPVSVVTAFAADRPHGTTVSAFCSLSLTPPMVLVALDEASALLEILRGTSRFGLNVLSHSQNAIAAKFAMKGDDKFDAVAWQCRSGVPHITGVACWFACDVERFVAGGDHIVIMGKVIESDHAELPPLTYHRRQFGTHAS
jgi:flavin reductase (DIM6/NTAB) family NADH-FMN oxidoreductase RutF